MILEYCEPLVGVSQAFYSCCIKKSSCAVYLVCVYEWVQTGLLTANLAVCSQAFFKPHPLIDLIGSFDNSSLWLCIFLMSAIISAAVQIFYAWRLYKLIGSPWVPGIIIMVSE